MNGGGDLRKPFMMRKKQLTRKRCSGIVEVLQVSVVTLNDTRSTRPTFEVLEKLGERSFGEAELCASVSVLMLALPPDLV